MLKKLFKSFLLLGALGSSSFAVPPPVPSLPLQEMFVTLAQSLPEKEIMEKLRQLDIQKEDDLKSFAQGPDAFLTSKDAHKMGLISLAQTMLGSGSFYSNYQKMILSALLDFKRYAVKNNPFSLKEGELSPILFTYKDQYGKKFPVTTYSFTYTILEQIQKRINTSADDMGGMRWLSAAHRVKDFLMGLFSKVR